MENQRAARIRSTLNQLLTNPQSILRYWYYKLLGRVYFKKLGRGSRFFGKPRIISRFSSLSVGKFAAIGDRVFIYAARGAHIDIGDRLTLNDGCYLVSVESIRIGNNVAIAEMVSIRDQEHKFDPEHGIYDQGYFVAPVVIGDNVWIGRGSYIGPGTTIGRGSIVGANSVVKGSFPPGVLIAGAPAKVKRVLKP